MILKNIALVLFYLLAAPLISFYGALLIFFFVSGVSGADKWTKDFLISLKFWPCALALVVGLAIWVYYGVSTLIKITS